MNKKSFIIVIVILLAIGGGIFYLLNSSSSDSNSKSAKDSSSAVPPTNDRISTESNPPTSTKTGTYVDYSEAVFSGNTDTTRLLFFHAPWCPQCRSLDQDITDKGAPQGVTIYKVDYDSNQALRKKYGVTLQTTVVRVNASGELEDIYVAYDEPTLESVSANLL